MAGTSKNDAEKLIGKSEGMEFSFSAGESGFIEVFTTRPDTIMGVTFIALSFNHPITKEYAKNDDDLQSWLKNNSKGSTSEISSKLTEKNGYKLKLEAIHPISKEQIEIWVSNYVLSYGFGALMGVPAHDQRDYDLQKYKIKIKQVIENKSSTVDITKEAEVSKGTIINSGFLDGLKSEEAKRNYLNWKETINYRLRNWGFQGKEVGVPIPMMISKMIRKKLFHFLN